MDASLNKGSLKTIRLYEVTEINIASWTSLLFKLKTLSMIKNGKMMKSMRICIGCRADPKDT